MVYSSGEADLTVSLVALKTKAKSAGYQLGNAISIVVSKPCLWELGTYSEHYSTVQDQFVQVGSDNSAIVASIVSGIDTNDLEDQRKTNAALKKYLLDAKK